MSRTSKDKIIKLYANEKSSAKKVITNRKKNTS